jgi:hypothetical protein
MGLDRFPEWFDDGVSDSGTAFMEHVLQVGQQIKHGGIEFPNMAWGETEETPARPQSGVRGEIMSVTQRGLVSAWAFDDALPHKNLRVRLLIRNEAGELVYKSQPERTYVHDPDLRQSDRIGRASIGLHGYRYQLPYDVLARYGGQQLDIELVTYRDGAAGEIGHRFNAPFSPGYRLPPLAAAAQ